MLGIDIGSYSIKIALSRLSGRKAVVERVVSEVLPPELRGGALDEASAQQIITRLLKKIGKTQEKVCLGISTSSAIIKTTEVDSDLSGDSLEGEVITQLTSFVPFPSENTYYDFVSLGKSTNVGMQRVLLAATRRDLVEKKVQSLNYKLVKEVEVDVEGFAYGQVMEKIKGKKYQDNFAIIDVGYKTTNVYIYNSVEMIFSREQQIGGQQLTELISELAGISLEDAEKRKINSLSEFKDTVLPEYLNSLAEQLNESFEFFDQSVSDVAVAYVVGGGSLVPGLNEILSDNIPNIKFEDLPTGGPIKIGKKATSDFSLEHLMASGSMAISLSMRK